MRPLRLLLLCLSLATACLLAGSAAATPLGRVVPQLAPDLARPLAPSAVSSEVFQDATEVRAAIEAALVPQDGIVPALPLPVDVQRSLVADDVAHYVMKVRTGPGPYDFIRVHRVVKVGRWGLPIRTAANVFLQHGDAKDFTGMFLPGVYSPATPDDFGFAVYAARRGVDVWGIDQAWNVVPQDLEDYSFMKDWGLERQARDLGIALRIARLGRLATGSGGGPMILSGYSSGVFTTLALLDAETQLPPVARSASAWIPVDLCFRTDHPDLLAFLQADLAYCRATYEAGDYAYYVPFQILGQLARCCPAEDSPVIPGFTNEQAALYFSAATLYPPNFHYWAGYFGPDGIPTGLRLVEPEMWLDFLGSAPLYEPIRFMMDYDMIWADAGSPFDDHLGEITVPVLNASPLGGFAALTPYAIGLLGSTDVENLFPTLGLPPELDMGHIDIWTTAEAEPMVWQPMVDWIAGHCGPPRGGRGSVPLAEAVPASGPALTIESVAPNPAPGSFRVSLALAGSEPARLDVVDVAGRTVSSQLVGGPGRQQVGIGAGQPLPPGLYLVRLAQGATSVTRRVAVVR
jgi:hypothetical protein